MWKSLVLLLFSLLLSGCQQQESTPESLGKIYPSTAYLQYFGEPPVAQQGYAYAQVGFLPLADGSGKVLPMPLFMYNESEHLDLILSQLFSSRLMVSARSQVSLPYAQGVQITQLDQAGDTLIVSLHVDGTGEGIDRRGIERAVVETATQFDDVSRVRVLYDGEPSEQQPFEGYQHDPAAIAPVPPPKLLDVVGVWEAEESSLKEILINFDRPVAVNSFRLLNAAGEQIAGKYFTSLFDMAVVVHPDQPEKFIPGITLNVSWDVEDRLGRRNSALDSQSLIRNDH